MANKVKRLYRSTDDRMLGGVAGGLGEYLDFDSTIIRLIFAFSVFLGGAGIVVYLVMWFIVPEEGSVTVTKATAEKAATAQKTATKKATVKKSSTTKKSAS